MEARRFQDLARFGGTARGGAAWRAQLWWLFQAVFVLPTPQYMFAWRRFARLRRAVISPEFVVRDREPQHSEPEPARGGEVHDVAA